MAEKALRVPPQDTEMERALLGALLLNQNAMYEVADLVGVDSFYSGKHRIVFDAMLSLYAKSEPIDVVTVSGKLKERKQLTEIGGAAFWASSRAQPLLREVRGIMQKVFKQNSSCVRSSMPRKK